MKYCKTCDTEKDLNEFSKGNGSQGLYTYCKKCFSDYHRIYRLKERGWVLYFYYHGDILLYVGISEFLNVRQRQHKCQIKKLRKNYLYFHKYCKENELDIEDLRLETVPYDNVNLKIMSEIEVNTINQMSPHCNIDNNFNPATILCDCGGCYTKTNKSRHDTNKKHLKFLESIEN